MPENTKNPLTLLLVRGCLTTECCFLWLSFPEISSAIPDWLRLPTQEDVACSADRLVVIQTSCSPAFFPSWGGWCGVSRTIGVLRRPILGRSEEHTSELQSRQYIVCRLLLEKKKSQ